MTTPSPDSVSTQLAAPDTSVVWVEVYDEWTLHVQHAGQSTAIEYLTEQQALLLGGLIVQGERNACTVHNVAVSLANDCEWTADTTDKVGAVMFAADALDYCPTCHFVKLPDAMFCPLCITKMHHPPFQHPLRSQFP